MKNKKRIEEEIEKLKIFWNKRNPQHDLNADSKEDMFWGTVVCVFNDLNKSNIGNKMYSREEVEKAYNAGMKIVEQDWSEQEFSHVKNEKLNYDSFENWIKENLK